LAAAEVELPRRSSDRAHSDAETKALFFLPQPPHEGNDNETIFPREPAIRGLLRGGIV